MFQLKEGIIIPIWHKSEYQSGVEQPDYSATHEHGHNASHTADPTGTWNECFHTSLEYFTNISANCWTSNSYKVHIKYLESVAENSKWII